MKWHLAFNHVNFDKLAKMCEYDTIEGLRPSMAKMFKEAGRQLQCLKCKEGHMKQGKINKQSPLINYKVGEYLYIDTIPMDKPSIGNNKFALVINDKTSSYTFVDTMLNNAVKTNIIPTVKRIINQIRLSNYNPKYIHADSDKVFLSIDMRDFCGQEQIILTHSPAGDHRVSGSIESVVRSLRRQTRTMLSTSGLPEKFWATAFRQAVYVRNRIITSRHERYQNLAKQSPYQIWFGKLPTANNLALYGAACVTRITNPEKLKSMEPRAKMGVYLGNTEEGSSGPINTYVVYLPSTDSIVTTRDVIINESVFGFTGKYTNWFGHSYENNEIHIEDVNTLAELEQQKRKFDDIVSKTIDAVEPDNSIFEQTESNLHKEVFAKTFSLNHIRHMIADENEPAELMNVETSGTDESTLINNNTNNLIFQRPDPSNIPTSMWEVDANEKCGTKPALEIEPGGNAVLRDMLAALVSMKKRIIKPTNSGAVNVVQQQKRGTAKKKGFFQRLKI
jgi:hypothetical protein